MLTGSGGVSFHDQGRLSASYVPTNIRIFLVYRPAPGQLAGGARLLLGEGPQAAQRPVLGHPDRSR